MIAYQDTFDEIARIGGKRLSYPLIDDDMLLKKSLSYFDKDGFELTELEQRYHQTNTVETSGILNHCSVAVPWVIRADDYDGSFLVDHGFLSARLGYDGDALDQIRRMMPKRPELVKLRSLRPKFGADLSIDFVPKRLNDLAMYPFEVLHLEYDYRDEDGLYLFCKRVERAVTAERIEEAAQKIVANADMLRELPSDDQADWKAELFGFERAFVTRPVI